MTWHFHALFYYTPTSLSFQESSPILDPLWVYPGDREVSARFVIPEKTRFPPKTCNSKSIPERRENMQEHEPVARSGV
jgi:hypothetical protein